MPFEMVQLPEINVSLKLFTNRRLPIGNYKLFSCRRPRSICLGIYGFRRPPSIIWAYIIQYALI